MDSSLRPLWGGLWDLKDVPAVPAHAGLGTPHWAEPGWNLDLDLRFQHRRERNTQGLQSISCWPRCAICAQMCGFFLYIKLILVFVT